MAFYINGNIVREPIVDVREWAVLGVSFANSLDFSNFSGSINLNGPFVYNNVTNYQSTSLQEIQSKVFRPWLKVKSSEGIDLFWSYWLQSYNWNGVLVLSTSELYGIDPSVVYKAYIGRNKTTINENTDVSLNFTLDSVKIYSDTSWQLEVKSPSNMVYWWLWILQKQQKRKSLPKMKGQVGESRIKVIDKMYDWGLYVYKNLMVDGLQTVLALY